MRWGTAFLLRVTLTLLVLVKIKVNVDFLSQEAGEFKSRRCFDKNPYQLSKQPHCSSFSSVCSYRMTCTFELRRRR